MFNVEVCNTRNAITEFVKKQKFAMVYHTNNFLNLLKVYLKSELYWIAISEGSTLVAVMPYLIKDGPFGKVYNSLPFYGSNGGLLCTESNEKEKRIIYRAATEEFYRIAYEDGAISATIISNPIYGGFEYYEEFSGYTYRDERIGQIKNLPKDKGELMSSYNRPRPRNIRKAISSNVVVYQSTSEEDFDYMITTHQENISSIGGLYKSREFFFQLRETLSEGMYSLYIAEIDKKRVAALLVLKYGKAVEYFTPCISEAYRSTQALSLVIHHAMQCAIEEGREIWNWGGTWLNQGGVYDFKKRWGTKDYNYYYYTKVFNNEIKKLSREVLLDEYKNFYVLPFGALEN